MDVWTETNAVSSILLKLKYVYLPGSVASQSAIDLATPKLLAIINRMKKYLSPQLPPPHPITESLLFALSKKAHTVMGNLPIAGKEGGWYGEVTEPGKYVTYKYIF